MNGEGGREATPSETREVCALVARLRCGDRAAEEEFVARFSGAVIRQLRAMTRDRDLADDLHQETFRIVLERLRVVTLRDEEKVGAYLRRTARNLALAERRRAVRRATALPPDVVDSSDDALTIIMRRELRSRVRDAVSRLPARRDRELLSRLYFAEECRETICRDLGVTKKHLSRLLFRARGRLFCHLK